MIGRRSRARLVQPADVAAEAWTRAGVCARCGAFVGDPHREGCPRLRPRARFWRRFEAK